MTDEKRTQPEKDVGWFSPSRGRGSAHYIATRHDSNGAVAVCGRRVPINLISAYDDRPKCSHCETMLYMRANGTVLRHG